MSGIYPVDQICPVEDHHMAGLRSPDTASLGCEDRYCLGSGEDWLTVIARSAQAVSPGCQPLRVARLLWPWGNPEDFSLQIQGFNRVRFRSEPNSGINRGTWRARHDTCKD